MSEGVPAQNTLTSLTVESRAAHPERWGRVARGADIANAAQESKEQEGDQSRDAETRASRLSLKDMLCHPWGVQGNGKLCEQTAPDAPKAGDAATQDREAAQGERKKLKHAACRT